MKHLKKFENINELEVGDYVILNIKYTHTDEYKQFLYDNVGKISEIVNGFILVEYKNVPVELRREFQSLKIGYGRWFDILAVVDFSKNEDDLKIKLIANKYNL